MNFRDYREQAAILIGSSEEQDGDRVTRIDSGLPLTHFAAWITRARIRVARECMAVSEDWRAIRESVVIPAGTQRVRLNTPALPLSFGLMRLLGITEERGDGIDWPLAPKSMRRRYLAQARSGARDSNPTYTIDGSEVEIIGELTADNNQVILRYVPLPSAVTVDRIDAAEEETELPDDVQPHVVVATAQQALISLNDNPGRLDAEWASARNDIRQSGIALSPVRPIRVRRRRPSWLPG